MLFSWQLSTKSQAGLPLCTTQGVRMKLKKIVLTSSLAFCTMFAASYAYAYHYMKKYYYSDATYTVKVGQSLNSCSGSYSQSGTITPYYKIIDTFNCNL
jgi:hypothetical protein